MARGKVVDPSELWDVAIIQRYHHIQLCEKMGRTEQELLSSSSRRVDDCIEVSNHIVKADIERMEKQKQEQENQKTIERLKRKHQ